MADCAKFSINRAKFSINLAKPSTIVERSFALSKAADQLGMVRASILTPIVAALDAGARDTDALLARYGLLRAQLRDPYEAVPLGRYVALFEAAAELIEDPTFGFRLGMDIRIQDLGPLGFLFIAAPTLRAGLTQFARYVSALQSATQIGLEDQGGWAVLTYQIQDPTIWPRIQDTQFTLAVMCTLIRTVLGRGWAPSEVHFEHSEPGYKRVLEQFFRAPVLFRQQTTRFVLDAVDLDRPLKPEDPGLTRVLERHAGDLRLELDGSARLSDRVRQLIGFRIGQERIAVARIAKDLGLSPRSLQRGLAAEQTSLRDLLRDHRRHMAEMRLSSGTLSNATIAEAIGYADSAVFWRAFKGWTGMGPRAFRRRLETSSEAPRGTPHKPQAAI